MTDTAPTTAPTEPVAEAPGEPAGVTGFKVRYLNGGTEAVGPTQGRFFLAGRQITIGSLRHLLNVEETHYRIRELLGTPDGLDAELHAQLVAAVWASILTKIGAEDGGKPLSLTTSSETLLGELERVWTEPLRQHIEAMRGDFEEVIAKAEAAVLELGALYSRARMLEEQVRQLGGEVAAPLRPLPSYTEWAAESPRAIRSSARSSAAAAASVATSTTTTTLSRAGARRRRATAAGPRRRRGSAGKPG